jgi:hypothetical protein
VTLGSNKTNKTTATQVKSRGVMYIASNDIASNDAQHAAGSRAACFAGGFAAGGWRLASRRLAVPVARRRTV